MSYYERRNEVASTTDILAVIASVRRWLADRPAVSFHDRNLMIMTSKLIPGEVDEAEVEANRRGTPGYSLRAEQSELTDSVFFVAASSLVHGIHIDPYLVRSGLNGHATQSAIHDQMREVAGNMSPSSQSRDLHRFLTLTLQYIADMPELFSLEASMLDVIDKNGLNYLKWAFNGLHPLTGRRLNPDELTLQYDHARKCLKFIRHQMTKVLNQSDREHGLKIEDWLPYMQDIQNFMDSDKAFAALQIAFCLDHGLHLGDHLKLRQ